MLLTSIFWVIAGKHTANFVKIPWLSRGNLGSSHLPRPYLTPYVPGITVSWQHRKGRAEWSLVATAWWSHVAWRWTMGDHLVGQLWWTLMNCLESKQNYNPGWHSGDGAWYTRQGHIFLRMGKLGLVGALEHVLFFHILGMSSSQLTNSYFPEW